MIESLQDLVDDPMTALPLRETSVALRGLAVLAGTDVAVISGRSLRDLAALSRQQRKELLRAQSARRFSRAEENVLERSLHRETGARCSHRGAQMARRGARRRARRSARLGEEGEEERQHSSQHFALPWYSCTRTFGYR